MDMDMDMDMDMEMDMNNCESQWTATVVVTGRAVGFWFVMWSVKRCGNNYSSYSSYSSATAELQQNYSSYSRATVTPLTTPPHKELQSRLQRSYSAATVRYSSYDVAPGLCLDFENLRINHFIRAARGRPYHRARMK